jgi:hypothetical protein
VPISKGDGGSGGVIYLLHRARIGFTVKNTRMRIIPHYVTGPTSLTHAQDSEFPKCHPTGES